MNETVVEAHNGDDANSSYGRWSLLSMAREHEQEEIEALLIEFGATK